jgi:diguanylate cyclase (GGDEF)-like protein/PAS domain S-box-containing protein
LNDWSLVYCVLSLAVLGAAMAAIPSVVWRRVGGRPLSYVILLMGVTVLIAGEAFRLAALGSTAWTVLAMTDDGGFPLHTAGFALILGGFLSLMRDVRSTQSEQRRLASEALARADEARVHKAKLEAILDGATDHCIITCDGAGRITSYSTGGARVLGWRPEEVVARKTIEIFRPADHPTTAETILKTVREHGHFEAEVPMVRKDGRRIAALVTATPLPGFQGRPDGYVVVAKDITEMKVARDALRRERDFVRGIIETNGMFIVGVSLTDGRITLFNHGAERISGYSREEVIGRPCAEVLAREADRGRIERLIESIRNGTLQPVGRHEGELLTKDGQVRSVSWTYSASADEAGRLTYVVGFGQDVTEQRRMQESLQEAKRDLEAANRALSRLATTDYLTGLLNRRQADDLLRRELDRARRQCSPVAVVLMDLDHFKVINDTRGHEVGDLCLKHVAAQLRGRFRNSDVVARYGGEEFLLVLPDTGVDEAAMLADQVRRRVQDNPMHHEGEPIRISLSAGVAVFELHRDTTPERLVRLADEAMYCSKNLGGNRVVVWDDVQQGTVDPSLTNTHQARELRRRVESLGRRNRRTFLENVYKLIDTIESRNRYTRGHSRCVARYATAIAGELGVGDDDLALIHRAAMLQDLGKAAIPEEVIWKDAALTKTDWALVCQHPAATVKILERLSFLHREVHLIRHHHERPDGRGYPDGLAGEAIPLGSRIMAVAEALDAMTRHRPHRQALSLEEALDQLRAGSFKQFDRKVVEAAAVASEKAGDWPLAESAAPAAAAKSD